MCHSKFFFLVLSLLLKSLNIKLDSFLNIIFKGNVDNILFFAKKVKFLFLPFVALLENFGTTKILKKTFFFE